MVEEVELEGFPERLKELIGQESVSRFANEVGLGDNLIRKYLDGATPGLDKVVRICNAKGVSIAWLALGEGPKLDEDAKARQAKAADYRRRRTDTLGVAEPSAAGREILESRDGRGYVLLPRYDVRVSAGGGTVVHSEQIVDYLAFKSDWFEREVGIPAGSAALFEVRGNSMESDFYDGDLALLDLRVDRFIDDAIYVVQYGDALRVKRVHRRLDGKVEIKSSNEAVHKPEVVTEEEASQIIIVGRAKRALPKPRRLP